MYGLPPYSVKPDTADNVQRRREACFAAGVDDNVTKPIRVDALVEALMRSKASNVT